MPYPRICGANGRTRLRACSQFPLPPRTWGKRSSLLDATRQDASTPTHVGQTVDHFSADDDGCLYPHARGANLDGLPTATNDIVLYPHARGANKTDVRPPTEEEPLPPRTWSKLHSDGLMPSVKPSTPTHVEQTAMNRVAALSESLYPHARGANENVVQAVARDVPLPPRTWSKLL